MSGKRYSAKACCRTVPKISLSAGGVSAASLERRAPPHDHAAWKERARSAARRFPGKMQAGAGSGRAGRASAGGRGRKVARSGAFMRQSRKTDASTAAFRCRRTAPYTPLTLPTNSVCYTSSVAFASLSQTKNMYIFTINSDSSTSYTLVTLP